MYSYADRMRAVQFYIKLGKREADRKRHQLGRLVAGIAEHQPLIARTDLTVITINAARNLTRLVIEGNLDLAALRINACRRVRVANLAQRPAHDALGSGLDIAKDHFVTRLEFTCDDNELVCEHGFTSNMRIRIAG